MSNAFQVLTNLATDANIAVILREFQTYIGSSDKEFVAATIQAIGRWGAAVDSCVSLKEFVCICDLSVYILIVVKKSGRYLKVKVKIRGETDYWE